MLAELAAGLLRLPCAWTLLVHPAGRTKKRESHAALTSDPRGGGCDVDTWRAALLGRPGLPGSRQPRHRRRRWRRRRWSSERLVGWRRKRERCGRERGWNGPTEQRWR